jgi:hypothetical protein
MSTKKIIVSNIITDIPTQIVLRNFMITTRNDIVLKADENVDLKCYGYTLISDNLKLSVEYIPPTTLP